MTGRAKFSYAERLKAVQAVVDERRSLKVIARQIGTDDENLRRCTALTLFCVRHVRKRNVKV